MSTPLDLTDLSVSQAVLMLHQAMEEAGTGALEVLLPPDPLYQDNLLRLLHGRGRRGIVTRQGAAWFLEVEAAPVRSTQPIPFPVREAPPASSPAPRGLVLTRGGLGGQKGGAARSLLFGVLRALPTGTPWVTLVLDAVELAEDAQARVVFKELASRGIPVLIGRGSGLLLDDAAEEFGFQEDVVWQRALAQGHAGLL